MAKENVKKSGWKNWFTRGKDCNNMNSNAGTGGALYGLGFLGAVIYNIQTATSIVGVVIGILKAIIWPAFVVYGVLKFLGM